MKLMIKNTKSSKQLCLPMIKNSSNNIGIHQLFIHS